MLRVLMKALLLVHSRLPAVPSHGSEQSELLSGHLSIRAVIPSLGFTSPT